MDEKRVTQRHVAHFGTIAFNYAMFAAAVVGFCLLGTIIWFLFSLVGVMLVLAYYVLLLALTVITVGALLLAEEFRGAWTKGGDFIGWIGDMNEIVANEIVPYLADIIPGALIAVLVLSVISFVCMMFDRKWEKTKSRLVFMGITIAVIIGILVALVIGLIQIGGAN